ncbi:MAG: hypothetical protein UT79_C0007G0001 [Candidatus Moranbacteria bacterium GW2011_GWC2_40_12]|nr:MAG: hypothetical protein UT79_C0007G0001 [Candidatus Moranbacteria bacterium GW2011_GWC2_40_12]
MSIKSNKLYPADKREIEEKKNTMPEMKPEVKTNILAKAPGLKTDEPLAEELITLSEIAKESVYSREYLGYLVRKKKLKAEKIGGEWKTTKKWLNEFSDEAEEKKKIIRQDLSQKLGKEKKNILLPGINLKYSNNSILRMRPLAALGMMVVLLALASLANANVANWRDEAARKILSAYDSTVEKVTDNFLDADKQLADGIHALKAGTDKIYSIANAVISRKKVDQYEKTTGLSIRGSEEEKEKIVRSEEETMGGIVAGEESSADGRHFQPSWKRREARSSIGRRVRTGLR